MPSALGAFRRSALGGFTRSTLGARDRSARSFCVLFIGNTWGTYTDALNGAAAAAADLAEWKETLGAHGNAADVHAMLATTRPNVTFNEFTQDPINALPFSDADFSIRYRAAPFDSISFYVNLFDSLHPTRRYSDVKFSYLDVNGTFTYFGSGHVQNGIWGAVGPAPFVFPFPDRTVFHDVAATLRTRYPGLVTYVQGVRNATAGHSMNSGGNTGVADFLDPPKRWIKQYWNQWQKASVA